MTGVTMLANSLGAKRLQLMRQVCASRLLSAC